MANAVTPETLLADTAWLKRLARMLAGSEDDADDLVQESWIAAWKRQPQTDRPLRPWLAKVVRDLSRMRHRGERRRATREAAVDDSREVARPDELLEQVRLHRLLADLVLELDEPFRSTIVAHFVDGQTSAGIAKSLDVPESTVRWRLREGLSRLRVRLDERGGGRKAWAPAVLAFARRGIEVAKPAKTVAVIIGLIAALFGGLVLMLALHGAKSKRSEVSGPRTKPGHRGPHGPAQSDGDDLINTLAAGRSPGWLSQEGVNGRRVAGHLLVDGSPVAGALVRLTSETSLAGLVGAREQRTRADGGFDFGPQVATQYALGAVVPGRVATVKRVDLRDPQAHADNVLLSLDPCAVGFFGKVMDSSGTPIPNAELLAQDVIGTTSDASGAFDVCLHAQGTAEDLRLVVRASGFGAIELEPALSGRMHHDFVLSPEGVVFGRAVTAHGQPVPNAEIRLDWDDAAPRPGSEQPAPVRATTDAEGRFHAAGIAAGRRRVGASARATAATPFTVDLGSGESKEITVTMTDRAVVRGRILLDGKPVAGITVGDRAESPTYQARGEMVAPVTEAVSQADGTFVLDGVATGEVMFSTTPYRLRAPKSVHVVTGEQSVTLEVEALAEIIGTVSRHGMPVPHSLVRAMPANGWASITSTETDEVGRFELRGLDAGDYGLFAHNATVGAFMPAGAKVHLELGEHRQADIDLAYGGRISGTVADGSGAPVTGVLVGFAYPEADDQGRCITDAVGHFDCGSLRGGGSYAVTVQAGEASPTPYRFVGSPPAPIYLADGDSSVDGIRLVVDVQRLAISGVIVDSSGTPIADARVLAIAGPDLWQPVPTTITDTAGHFELDELAAADYSLQAIGPDSSQIRTAPMAAGKQDVRIVLAPGSCDSAIDPNVGTVGSGAPADITRPPGRVVWDDRVELVGWSLPERVRLGDSFQITLVYRVLQPVGRSWKIFIHVDGPKMRVIGDHDPLGGRCPTSAWKPGDILVDHFTTRIDPAMDAGAYDVWTGFFTGLAPTWKNMPVTQAPAAIRDPHDRVRVATVVAE